MEEQEEVWSENREKVKTENLCLPLTEWKAVGQAPQGSCIHSQGHHWVPGDSALKPKRQESRLWLRCTQHRGEVGRSLKPELKNGHSGHVTTVPAYVALARSLFISGLTNKGGSR